MNSRGAHHTGSQTRLRVGLTIRGHSPGHAAPHGSPARGPALSQRLLGWVTCPPLPIPGPTPCQAAGARAPLWPGQAPRARRSLHPGAAHCDCHARVWPAWVARLPRRQVWVPVSWGSECRASAAGSLSLVRWHSPSRRPGPCPGSACGPGGRWSSLFLETSLGGLYRRGARGSALKRPPTAPALARGQGPHPGPPDARASATPRGPAETRRLSSSDVEVHAEPVGGKEGSGRGDKSE